jgi:hypothetical protein
LIVSCAFLTGNFLGQSNQSNGSEVSVQEANIISKERGVLIEFFFHRRQLSHLGCTYEIANNGSNALQLLQQNPERFSVILMDIEMPILGNFTGNCENHKQKFNDTTLNILTN